MKKVLYLAACVMFMASCSSNTVDLAIDNPTDAPVSLYVDSLYVEVPPMEIVWVEMGKGEHTIRLSDTSVKFNFQETEYMINPTRSEYLLTEELYGTPGLAAGTMPSKTVSFYGIPLTGSYDVFKDVVIPVKWEYGPRQEVPGVVEVDEDENFASLTKLNDINDFKKLLGTDVESFTEDSPEYLDSSAMGGMPQDSVPSTK